MISIPDETGMSRTQLLTGAWLLGVVAVLALLGLLLEAAGDGRRVQPEHVAMMAVAGVAAVFSACCAVLLGIRTTEGRLYRELRPRSDA